MGLVVIQMTHTVNPVSKMFSETTQEQICAVMGIQIQICEGQACDWI